MMKTKRLGLRLVEKNDIDNLFALESDADVPRFTPVGAKTYEQALALIDLFISDYVDKGLPCFLIFDLVSHEFIGRAGFFIYEGDNVEVGYSFHKKFWGRGYATEILSLLLAWAKNNITTDYIYACVELGNLASFRVLEKCGMRHYKSDIEKDVEYRFYRIENR